MQFIISSTVTRLVGMSHSEVQLIIQAFYYSKNFTVKGKNTVSSNNPDMRYDFFPAYKKPNPQEYLEL